MNYELLGNLLPRKADNVALIALAVLALTGCAPSSVSVNALKDAQVVCEPLGGLISVSVDAQYRNYALYEYRCKDATVYRRLPEEDL